MSVSEPSLTRRLASWNEGQHAVDAVFDAAYVELARISRALVRRERHRTLDTSGLVHEAYLRLLDLKATGWRDRAHFYIAAAGAMRRVLVDRARARGAIKRGGDAVFVTLDDDCAGQGSEGLAVDLVALDAALAQLEQVNPSLGQVVQLRFFGGQTVPQTARTLGVSSATVKRRWLLARAWLYRELMPAGSR